MTLVLVVLVPIVCNQYISPAIVDAVGDNHILMLSSEMIVNLLMWAVILGFMLLLGGSMILKKCGICILPELRQVVDVRSFVSNETSCDNTIGITIGAVAIGIFVVEL